MANNITLGWIGLSYEEEQDAYDITLSWAAVATPAGVISVELSWAGVATPPGVGGSSLSSKMAFLKGSASANSSIRVYLQGYLQSSASSTLHAFSRGLSTDRSSIHAYIPYQVRSAVHGFMYGFGIERTHIGAFSMGYEIPGDASITLITDDEAFYRYFRVLAADYDDGTLNRSETYDRTVDGKLSHDYGSIYKTWSAMLKIRQEETETNYGSLEDLQYFYKLNNPVGTPSTRITLIDHHRVTHYINLFSNLQIQLLSCSIVGQAAWFIYRLTFVEVAQ